MVRYLEAYIFNAFFGPTQKLNLPGYRGRSPWLVSLEIQQNGNLPMKHDSESDARLVTLAEEGSGGAFAELTRRNYNASLKLAQSILRDRQEAEDEVQNAYWKAYQRLEQFHHDAKFAMWMMCIVVNQCLMRLRLRRRADFLYLDEVPATGEQRVMELPDATRTPEQSLGEATLTV